MKRPDHSKQTPQRIVAGAIPKYRQLLQILRNEILSGRIPAGAKIPSEDELTVAYGLSRGTVRKAVEQLEAEGLIHTEHGVGSFVRDVHPGAIPFYFSTEGPGEEDEPAYEVLAQEVIPAPLEIAERLSLAPGAPVIHVVRRRLHGGGVISIGRRYLPEQLCPELAHVDLSRGSIHAVLVSLSELPLLRAEIEIEARIMTEDDAQALDAVPGQPAVVIQRMTYTAPNRPAVFYQGMFLHDYRMTVHMGDILSGLEAC
jgi:GntR family transcriptional regulator